MSLKLKFKHQAYQEAAVEAVLDCFNGQSPQSGNMGVFDSSYGNAPIALLPEEVLKNIQNVQRKQNLPVSGKLSEGGGTNYNLDIEMETGTGKTYSYLKTAFEMNRRYGWSKFIIIVPSIAIREGVYKTLDITREHFQQSYGKKARFFIYNSKRLDEISSFSSDNNIHIMIINMQAFNAKGADNRRIYDEQDSFQSRKPIDVIAETHPVLILDEPQKMEGKATRESLPKFRPLMILRYSATHKTTHNLVYCLDARDAYQQKLVKKIAVRGIEVENRKAGEAYLYLQGIDIFSDKPPVARVEMEVLPKSGQVKRVSRKLKKGDNLFVKSGELEAYHDRYIVSEIDYRAGQVEFLNGRVISVGTAQGDVTESDMRRIQIEEAINAHFDKERALFGQGVKVLSLFFIDTVSKYRDYTRSDELGEYARIFEEKYKEKRQELLAELPFDSAYHTYLERDKSGQVHEGYFSIDKNRHLVDPDIKARGATKGLSDDVSAYDLILKDKERLLSFGEPVRFVFSHSALREGWDNPNVFVMCMLKHSDNDISRRQEVGRGLRLAVNQRGDRMDDPATVHDINVLTIITSESYTDFVTKFQEEEQQNLRPRPEKATKEFFTGRMVSTSQGDVTITAEQANKLHRYLVKYDYVDDSDHLSESWEQAREAGDYAPLPEDLISLTPALWDIIESVKVPPAIRPENAAKLSKNPLNKGNFDKKEFQELWARINHKAVYRVDFDSQELIVKCVRILDDKLDIPKLHYRVVGGQQDGDITFGKSWNKSVNTPKGITISESTYDIIGQISAETMLTRRTVLKILRSILPAKFAQFGDNPELFLAETVRLINEQKATMVIEHLTYHMVEERYDTNILFPLNQNLPERDKNQALEKMKKNIYEYLSVDSKGELQFADDMERSEEVVVYTKLPRGFAIPTPVGNYNPDWAIAFKRGVVKHIYFVAETKGSLSSLQLREDEKIKIEAARKFFSVIEESVIFDKVKYDVVTDYKNLLNKVMQT